MNSRNLLHYYATDLLDILTVEKGVLDPEGIMSYVLNTIAEIARKTAKIEGKLLDSIGRAIDKINPESTASISRQIKKIEGYIKSYSKKAAPLSSGVVYDNSEKFYKAVKKKLSGKFDVPYTFIQPDKVAIKRVNTYQHVFIGDHYNDKVTKQVSKVIRDTIAETEVLDAKAIARKLKKAMPKYAKQKGYYETVANQVLNNARSYSSMRFYEDAGIDRYQVLAILDEVTSIVCKTMDGTILEVKKTLKNFKRYDDCKTKEDVKDVNPWMTMKKDGDDEMVYFKDKLIGTNGEMAGGLTGPDLQAMGVNSPPFHARPYSEDTELYTDEGWKSITKLTGKELFLSPSPEGLMIEWVEAEDLTVHNPKGKMVHFKSQNMNLLVGLNHDQVYSRLPWNKTNIWRTEIAEKLIDIKKAYIPRCANWRGDELKDITIGNDKIDIKTFIQFMAHWLSDGSVTKRGKNSYYISITNRKRQDIIYENIKELPYKLYRRKKRIEFYNTNMGKYLSQFGHAPDKYIPRLIKELIPELIKVFLDAYLICDGSIVKTYGKYSSDNSVVKTFFTTSKRLADDIGECILKAGGYPAFDLQKQAGKRIAWLKHPAKCNYDVWRIRWNKSKTATFGKNGKGNISIVPYEGKAYCVILKKNHILWVRRNGKTCFSGNCRTTVVPVI